MPNIYPTDVYYNGEIEIGIINDIKEHLKKLQLECVKNCIFNNQIDLSIRGHKYCSVWVRIETALLYNESPRICVSDCNDNNRYALEIGNPNYLNIITELVTVVKQKTLSYLK